MAFVEINDTRLFYTDEGEGPVLVLAHAMTADSRQASGRL